VRFGATVLYVNDIAAAVDFYRRAFGLTLRFHDEALGFAELETGGCILALASHAVGELLMPGFYSSPEGGRPAGVEIGFLTDDVSAAFARLLAAGATPIAAPKRMPWGLEVAYARAPDGTILGLSEPPASDAEGGGGCPSGVDQV
jgi:catechol 2,3-dioxygenase-like lactoylglutathione lyase family enzyme